MAQKTIDAEEVERRIRRTLADLEEAGASEKVIAEALIAVTEDVTGRSVTVPEEAPEEDS